MNSLPETIEPRYRALVWELIGGSIDYLRDLEPSDLEGRLDASGDPISAPVARGLIRKLKAAARAPAETDRQTPGDHAGDAEPLFSIGSSAARRMQTLAVASFSLYTLPLISLFSASLYWFVLCSRWASVWLAAPVLAYTGWFALVDESPYKPVRTARLAAGWWWTAYADYFPVTLVKTAELDPDGRYVLGYHPHGVISVGAFAAFATEGARTLDLTAFDEGDMVSLPRSAVPERASRGFASLFPGIDRRLVTLAMNFM